MGGWGGDGAGIGAGIGVGLGQEMDYCTLVVRDEIKGDMNHGCETT